MQAYLFPGQGSQIKGMGTTLFDALPEFAQLETDIDALLGYSLRKLCLADPDGKLNETAYTQPALYVVNALHYLQKQAETGQRPDYVAGHSLGEYNALLAAGAFDFMTGLRLVQQRGALMAQVQEGGMLVVVGLDIEQIQECLSAQGVTTLDLANHNSQQQTVLAGPKVAIEQVKPLFEAAGARLVQQLPVSAPFHSRYMKTTAQSFANFLAGFEFAPLQLSVIANQTGRPYPAHASSAQIKDLLVAQIDQPVQWNESMRYLLAKGVTDFEEIGPGTVLTGLTRRIRREAPPLQLEAEDGSVNPATTAQATPTPAVTDVVMAELDTLDTLPTFTPTTNGHEPQHERTQAGLITAESLGSAAFKADYGLKYAYIAGAMYKGIASKELVVAMGKAGLIGYLGTGGMKMGEIEADIRFIQQQLSADQSYGMNLLCNLVEPAVEEQTVDLFLRHGVRYIEAAAYMQITSSLVRYRLHGIQRQPDGTVTVPNHVLAKVSRPEVATLFMQPAPQRIIDKLVASGQLTAEQAELSRFIPISEDICVEADSGGHTDQGVAYALMPAMISLRNELMAEHNYTKPIRIGAAGGIGTPEAASAAFMLGAEFILTGSINQCTVEAGMSDVVKDMLQGINVQDTAYAPAGDMFELGAKVQVLRRGVFFPARANKLYALYQQYNSLDEIDAATQRQIQEKYFKRSFDDVWAETKAYYQRTLPAEITKAEQNPKHKMALIFRWYFVHSTRLAMNGSSEQRVDYQVHCGPALGAFNQWVKSTELEEWRNRHVDQIGIMLMQETATLLNQRFAILSQQALPPYGTTRPQAMSGKAHIVA